jgi:hypothetical protein
VDPWWPPPSDRSNPTSAAPAWPFSGMMRLTDYFDLLFDWAIDEPHCALEWNLERQIDPFVCIQEKKSDLVVHMLYNNKLRSVLFLGQINGCMYKK